jgi:hypothetical protein
MTYTDSATHSRLYDLMVVVAVIDTLFLRWHLRAWMLSGTTVIASCSITEA